ncbi:MAG: transcriptional regulator NrdR [Candidatus Palauibacterales bacterium]|nr:transcriptional regulator NrdR [Candidatus Palauibacterales bacterium]
MRCPYCGNTNNRVVDSRASREGRAIRRRRECQSCQGRFTTYERIEQQPLSIKKRDGSLEPFDRSKLIRGIQVACARRPVRLEQIEGIAEVIEEALERAGAGEVDSQRIGTLVMERLRDIDQVAYVRFASVYRNFQVTEEYLDAVRALAERRGYDDAQLDFLESVLSDESTTPGGSVDEDGE